MNLPNAITWSRILSVPVFVWMLLTTHLSSAHGHKELLACVVFALAAISDGVDGRLARKRNQTTTMGILLDPLADKLLVVSALIVLVQFNPHIAKPWIVMIVIGRELTVSGLRALAAAQGLAIQASDLGKLKMVAQVVTVIAAVLDHRWWQADWSYAGVHFVLGIDLIAKMSLWFMIGVSIISAVDYFIGFWSVVDRSSSATPRMVMQRKARSAIVARS
ncbi:MAG: CDP-diacylglycerol--glycerol-3-phosphate 3-phosphatidyltransferase [Acidobacteriaceae bacterium]|nr:CDP-diacylglycerol--glycerol-3-phosphate 3-phosphatidyltransferase [Acidobacteriaceae bacterium]